MTQQIAGKEASPIGFGNPKPSLEIQLEILRSIGGSAEGLHDIYAWRLKSRYSWEDFVGAIGNMASQGLITGLGDGFIVRYMATPKGRAILSSQ